MGGGWAAEFTFMGFWVLVEEEERDSILEEGIAQQLKALIGDVFLAGLGSQGFQHIHYVGLPAHPLSTVRGGGVLGG